jgi:hypothetical protein
VHEFDLTEPEVAPPPLDADGLPVRRRIPMNGRQARQALWLESTLRELRRASALAAHIEVDDPVDYLDAANARGRVFPDVYAVVGLAQQPSGPFRTWITRRPPDVVVEIAVESSLPRDLGEKLVKYEQMGVREYFVFDLDMVAVEGLLVGYRLGPRGYQQIPSIPSATLLTRLHSERLELDVGIIGDTRAERGYAVRLFRPGEDAHLPTEDEAAAARDLERLRAEKDRELAEKDRELAALRRRLGETPPGSPPSA